ncbi:zinc metalloproteinase nas-14-like [Asterias amurensis]|uniref:zinc metalloproteinase nas-14-like n=1 Tax=Asterias amurensis TaxID=7602 RepID=UPI003AB157B3
MAPALATRSKDSVIKQVFLEAVAIYKEHTVVSFEEALDDYSGTTVPIVIYGLNVGCSSSVGYSGSQGQNMKLQTGRCQSISVIPHEIGHALGRFHEHNRSDRDDYVTINETNILYGFEHNFKKVDQPLLAPYDIQSIMHYHHSPCVLTTFGIGVSVVEFLTSIVHATACQNLKALTANSS